MKNTRTGAASAIFALSALVACTSAAWDAPNALTAGTWTADLKAPELPVAIGFLGHMGAGGDSLRMVVLEVMGFSGGPVSALRVRGDTLSFVWDSEKRQCALLKDAAGAFAGECVHGSDTAWQMHLFPPSQRRVPVGHARTIAARTDYAWKRTEESWGRLYRPTRAGTPTVETARVSQEIDRAVKHGLAILGATRYDRPLDAFLVEGREDLRALTGTPVGSTADPLGSTVVLAKFGSLETVVHHEVMHVLSVNVWGEPPEPAAWLREGLATYAAGRCAAYSLHQLSANMDRSGELLPLETLITDFYKHSDLVTYLESGSVIQYLYDTRGRDFLRKAWQQGLARALTEAGSSIAAFERAWLTHLRTTPLQPEIVDWKTIKGIGCG